MLTNRTWHEIEHDAHDDNSCSVLTLLCIWTANRDTTGCRYVYILYRYYYYGRIISGLNASSPSLPATSTFGKMGTLGVLISPVNIPEPDLNSNQDKHAKYVCLARLYGKKSIS